MCLWWCLSGFVSLGTGKTTVAKLYGHLLKDFGLLSDGGIIVVTPSDLKGQAQGEAAATAKKIIESAKGKVSETNTLQIVPTLTVSYPGTCD